MKIDIMTLFPEMCERVVNESIIGRAIKAGKVEICCTNIRDYAGNKHNKVDDTPYGGGMGMIMSAQPVFDCFNSLFNAEREGKPYLIYMSPKGKSFNQNKAVELSKKDHIVLLCGHYEGIDQRVIDKIVDEEISIGDYVLTGGELPALVVADAVCRMLPGVLSNDICFEEESHFAGTLEFPQYTRPAIWQDMPVPDVLLSGNHAQINKWRNEKSIEETFYKRPDIIDRERLSKEQLKLLNKFENKSED